MSALVYVYSWNGLDYNLATSVECIQAYVPPRFLFLFLSPRLIVAYSCHQGEDSPAHLTLASLEGFLENLMASNSALGEDRSSGGLSPQNGRCHHHHRSRPLFNSDCGGAPSTAGTRVICVRAENGISRIYGDSDGGNADSGEVIVGAGRLAKERFPRVEDDLEVGVNSVLVGNGRRRMAWLIPLPPKLCISHVRCTNSGYGERRRHNNWSLGLPGSTAPVTRATLKTTGSVPAESRRRTPSIRICVAR